MRRAQIDSSGQAVRNLLTNPQAETLSSLNGVTVTTNLCAYPSMEATTGGTVNVRTNLSTNPAGVFAFPEYATGTTTGITPNVAITNHPEGLTTANRVTYTSGATPGVALFTNPTSGTFYTISCWVYHESIEPTAGTAALAQAGVASQSGAPAIAQGVWQKHSWTVAATGTNHFGFRVNGQSGGSGSFLITGVVVEAAIAGGPYFDGSMTGLVNLASNPSLEANSTGWGFYSGATGSATVSRQTTGGYKGAAFWRGSYTVSQTGVAAGGGYSDAPIPAGGHPYSAMMAVRSSKVQKVVMTFEWLDSSKVLLTRSLPATYDLPAGAWTELRLENQTAPANAAWIRCTVYSTTAGGVAWLAGDTFDMDAFMVVYGATAPAYFEGLGDFTYAWTGTANASTSVMKATGIGGWAGASTSNTYQTSQEFAQGSKGLAVYTRGSSGDGAFVTDINAIPGESYTISAWIKITGTLPNFSGSLRFKDASQNTLGDYNTSVHGYLVVGQWVRVSVTAVAPANSSKLQAMWRIFATHTPTTFYVDGMMATQLPYDVPYFDGNTAAAGDYNYIWNGIVNQSTSTQRGSGVAMIGQMSAGPAVQSSDWSASGSKSIRVSSRYRGFDSYTTIGGDGTAGVLRAGLEAGKTYTLLWKMRLARPLTNVGASTRWGRPVVFCMNAQGLYIESQLGTAPVNATGVYSNRGKFTVPAGATQAFIRLYNGTYGGDNGDVWYDDLMLVEGDYQGDYINPDQNLLAKWDGAAHASSSVGYPPTLGDVAGTPILDYSAPGTYTLDDSFGPQEARTFYTVIDALGENFSGVSPIIQYGSVLNDLPDPYTWVQLRQDQNSSVADGLNNLFLRRTGAAGVSKPSKATSRHVMAWGVTAAGNIFLSVDNGAVGVDNVVMNMGHKTLVIISDQPLNKHVRTIAYRGEHNAATRQAISRYLGNKYGVAVA